MARNVTRTGGAPPINKDSAGGAVLLPHACLGIVKDNIDPTHSGRIKVYINQGGSVDANDSRYWYPVSYLSPYFGVIAPNYDVYGERSADKTGYGKYIGNPHSYGFWATAPDVGTTVLCVFVNGRSDQGYYIGCVPEPGLTHMVPAIGSGPAVVPNSSEAGTYGGSDRLPTTEVNNANPGIRNSPAIYNIPKPVHSYQASILAQQGLTRDNLRGTIGSSSQRETPSRVVGLSTPGGPVYTGGYDKTNIKQAAKTEDISKLQTIGRTGGHSFVMDDGDQTGQDQLIRIRTSGGHMIMMNDSGQNLTLVHANGQTWIELGREGTIDMYATNSVNIRTEGDLNLHADRDINMHAKRNIQAFAENIKLETDKNLTIRTNESFNQYTARQYTVKVEGPLSLDSQGAASIQSAASTFVKGKKVMLNSGATPIVPQEVKAMPKNTHIDTTFSQKSGWMQPSPEPLVSLTTRAPTHWPYEAAGRGVDVKTGSAQPAQQPQPSAGVIAASAASAGLPGPKTFPSLVATAPNIPSLKTAGGTTLSAPTVQGLISQQAVAGQSLNEAGKIQSGIVGPYGTTLSQLGLPGQSIKPGAETLINALRRVGMPGDRAASKVLMTGNYGVSDYANLVSNKPAQAGAIVQGLEQGLQGLSRTGIIQGGETSTQVAGVVQAAANFGVAKVTEVLKDPASAVSGITRGLTGGAASTLTGLSNFSNPLNNQLSQFGSGLIKGQSIGSAFPNIGTAINGGNFTGLLADKFNSGATGVVTSIQGLVGSNISSLASVQNITGGFNSVLGGASGLTGNLNGLLGNFGGLNNINAVTGQLTSSVTGLLSGSGSISSVTNLLGGGGLSSLGSLGSLGGLAGGLGSLGGLAGGLGAVSGVLGGLFGGGGIGSSGKNVEKVADLINSLRGASQNSFLAAEGSFVPLKANSPNFLGGSRGVLASTAPASSQTSTLDAQEKANTQLTAAQQAVDNAKALYRQEPTEANLEQIRVAELYASESLKRVQAASQTVLGSLTPNTGLNAQQVSENTANLLAQVSGEQAVATTANSGVNAIPGGLGVYANEVSKDSANIIKSVRTATSVVTGTNNPVGGLTGVASNAVGGSVSGALTDAKNFVGNIVGKAGNAVSGFVDNTLGKISSLPVVGKLFGSFAGAAKSVTGGLMGRALAGLGSLGNTGGQIRPPIVARDTFAAAPTQAVKVSQLLGDPRVPKPAFPDRPVAPTNDIAADQLADINSLNTITQLENERERLIARYNQLQLELATSAANNSGNVQQINEQMRTVNTQLGQVSDKISAITNNWFA